MKPGAGHNVRDNGTAPAGAPTGGPGGPAVAGRVRSAVAVLLLVALSQWIFVLPVFREVLQGYLGITDREYGLLFSVGMLGGMLAILPAGMLATRCRPATMIRFSAAGMAAAFLVIALAGPDWRILAAGLGLAQMTIVPLNLAAQAYFIELFPAAKRRVLSLQFVARDTAGTLVPLLGEGFLTLARRTGGSFAALLHGSFLWIAAGAVAALAFCRSPVPATAAPRPAGILAGFHFAPRVWALIALASLHGVADGIFTFWWPRFMGSSAFTGHSVAPGVFVSGYSLAYCLSRAGLSLLPEHQWRRRLMVFPGLCGGAVLIAGILSRNYLATGIGYVLCGLLVSAEYPAFVSRLAEEDHKRFLPALALSGLLTAAGTALALAAMGFLVAAMGEVRMWQPMLLPACLYPAVGIGAAIWLWRDRRRHPGVPAPAGDDERVTP